MLSLNDAIRLFTTKAPIHEYKHTTIRTLGHPIVMLYAEKSDIRRGI